MNPRGLVGCCALGSLLVASLGLLLPAPAGAATGLSFLKVGAGARAVALGDAVVSDVSDASATYWNPAALAFVPGNQAELMHNESFQGLRYEYASLTHSVGQHFGTGLDFNGIWATGLHSYDESGTYLGDFAYYGLAAGASFGYRPWENVAFGAGVDYLREAMDVYNTSGLGLNLGMQAREVLPHTQIGLAVLHLGSSMKYETESFDLPTAIQGGISRHFPIDALGGELLLAAEVRKVRDETTELLLGTEYSYRNSAHLQFGYRSGLDTQDISMGVGFGGRNIRAEYAYVPFSENLGNEQRFSLMVNW